ncbi:MAG: FAD-dependent oxidoreductase [Chromatiales bacterium]|nr:FAD-dependent oxidoreductase [Chromatiales bacterium]
MIDYDLVVIGGGIHGVGAAQAAAAAGHTVLLLEQYGLAHGTSSRSTKLIHGGLRYLESGQLRLVRECLRERQLLTRIAPGLVRIEPIHIPVYEETSRSRLTLRSGLALYALLGGLGCDTRFSTLGRNNWPDLDGLRQQGLKGVFRYYDGRTDDAALTRAVMQSALALGAEAAIPAEFLAAEVEPDGVMVRYRLSGSEKCVRCAALVNAAGPWVNEVQSRISPTTKAPAMDLVQGSHLVLEGLALQHGFYLEAPQDRRAIFLLPWQGRALLGTTESPYRGDPEEVSPLAAEQAYLLEVLHHYFPQAPGVVVASAFAGLRVLPGGSGGSFHKPRDTLLHQSHPRVVGVYGGKLTTYRLEAQRVIALLRDVVPSRRARGDTSRLVLT